MDDFREWLSDNLRYILLGLAVILIIVIAVFAVKFISRLGDHSTSEKQSESQAVIEDTEKQSESETPNALVQNEPAVLTLVQNYYAAVQNKDIEALKKIVESLDEQDQQAIENNQLIESYNNISVYSKNGPVAGSYVVYACYDGKLVGFDTMVPSLTYLYVCTAEDGSLYVANQNGDEVVSYIEKTNQEADVKALADDVAKKCEEAEASDPALAEYMQSLSVPDTESVIPDSSQAGVEVNKLVQAKEVCNIRADSTEDAEIIGALNAGDKITRIKTLDNGWSEVRLSNGSGYVRSDLLTEDITE